MPDAYPTTGVIVVAALLLTSTGTAHSEPPGGLTSVGSPIGTLDPPIANARHVTMSVRFVVSAKGVLEA